MNKEFDLDVYVSTECLREGKPKLCNECPVALAIRNSLYDHFGLNALIPHVSVTTTRVSLYDYNNKTFYDADLPSQVVSLTERVDANMCSKPIRFTLHFEATSGDRA